MCCIQKYSSLEMKSSNYLLLVITAVLIKQQCSAVSLSSSFEVQSNDSCPPGFGGSPCRCESSYKGIRCNCYRRKAYVIHGYWVGECDNGALCTGNCPFGFCMYNGSTNFRLPGSISELDEYMCGPTRTGVLCGECRDNHSVSYHSYTYTCTTDDKCNYGLLLYIVSELIPLTVMFIIVIAFNISFTSGAVNGFILFAQLQDSLGTHADGVIRLPSKSFYISGYEFIYRLFNFDFFGIEKLSFCLWRGATVLDAMAFKYVTIAFALLLVLSCVYVVNSPKVKRCFLCLRPTTLRTSLVHGLTAFFIMCYSQCARVSFHILRSTSLYTKDDYLKTVVFRSGQLTMFEPAHLKYAIPALFFMSTLLLLPPVVLISYPLVGTILSRCDLSESKVANYISRLVPIQLLDSFQSSLRDKVRFIAGFYFLYRLVPLITFCISHDNIEVVYSSLAVIFIALLTFHGVVQPYKVRIHNLVDMLILANLAAICVLSLFNYQRSICKIVDPHPFSLEHESGLSYHVQLMLIYLPIVSVLLVGLFKLSKAIVRCCKTKCCSRQLETTPLLLTDSCDLPPLREE